MLSSITLKDSISNKVQFGRYFTNADVDILLHRVYPPKRHIQVVAMVMESFDSTDFQGAVVHLDEPEIAAATLDSLSVHYAITRPNYRGVIYAPAITLISLQLVETYLMAIGKEISIAADELETVELDLANIKYSDREGKKFELLNDGSIECYKAQRKVERIAEYFRGSQL